MPDQADAGREKRVHESSDSLRPASSRYQSPRPASTPFEPIDPSPITSDKTDIEDTAVDDEGRPGQLASPGSGRQRQSEKTVRTGYGVVHALGLKSLTTLKIQVIDTTVPMRPRSSSSETPQSVIHAPEGFRELVRWGLDTCDAGVVVDATQGSEPDQTERGSPNARKTPSPAPRFQATIETAGEIEDSAESEVCTGSAQRLLASVADCRFAGRCRPSITSANIDRGRWAHIQYRRRHTTGTYAARGGSVCFRKRLEAAAEQQSRR